MGHGFEVGAAPGIWRNPLPLPGDGTMDHDDDLAFVRHQLAGLIDARCIAGLGPTDALWYQQLCELESELLRTRSDNSALLASRSSHSASS